MEHFFAQSHIYHGSTGKVLNLINFPLELGYEDYTLLDKAVKYFWVWSWFYPQRLHQHIRAGCIIDEDDSMPSSVSSGFLHSVLFLLILEYSLLLSPNLMNIGARLQLCFCLYYRKVKCELLSGFITFSVIQLHLDSGLFCHLIISFWILPVRALIRVFL